MYTHTRTQRSHSPEETCTARGKHRTAYTRLSQQRTADVTDSSSCGNQSVLEDSRAKPFLLRERIHTSASKSAPSEVKKLKQHVQTGNVLKVTFKQEENDSWKSRYTWNQRAALETVAMCRKLKTITHYLYLFKIIKCLVQESKCMMRFKVYDVYDNHCTELEAKRKYTSKVFTLRIGGLSLGSRQWQVEGVYSKS